MARPLRRGERAAARRDSAARDGGASDPGFPIAGWGERRGLALAGSRAWAFGPLPPEVELALPAWVRGAAVEGATELKPGVARLGGLVIKRFPPPRALNRLRAPAALRSAERHFACLPIPSPRPLVAAARGRRGPSLLVREHVEGVLLSEAFGRDAGADEALPAFLAALERHRVLHGDLHPGNVLWDGARWVLLDVDGVRHGLHASSRVRLGQWTRLLDRLGDEERVERVFRRAVELGGGRDRTDWNAVRRRVRLLRERRARDDSS